MGLCRYCRGGKGNTVGVGVNEKLKTGVEEARGKAFVVT